MALEIMENPVEIIRVPLHLASGYVGETDSRIITAGEWRRLFRKAGIKLLKSLGSICPEAIITDWLGPDEGEGIVPPAVIFRDCELRSGVWMGDAYYEGFTSLFIHVRKNEETEAVFGLLILLLRELRKGYMPLGRNTDVGLGIFEDGGPLIFESVVDKDACVKALADYVKKLGVVNVPDAGEDTLLTGFISYQLTSKSPLFIPNPTGERAYPALLEKLGMPDGEGVDFYSYTDLSKLKGENAHCPKPMIPGSAIKSLFKEYYGILSQLCRNYEVGSDNQSEIEVIRELLESDGRVGEREAAIRFADMEIFKDRARLHQYFHPLLTMPESGRLRIIRPLAAGVRFRGKIYFHNLTKKEVDRLLWLFQSGENKQNGYQAMNYELGEERAKGFGKVEISLNKVKTHSFLWSRESICRKDRTYGNGAPAENKAKADIHRMTNFYLGEAKKIRWLDPAADFVPGRLYKAQVRGISSTGKTINILVDGKRGTISRKIWTDFSRENTPKDSEIDVIFQWDFVRKDGSTGYCFRQVEA